jgi:antirestriction protein
MTTTLHLGDRTSNCEECKARDYIAEAIENNNYGSNAETIESALRAFQSNSPTYYTWETIEDWFGQFEEAYQGEWSSEEEFAEDIVDNSNLFEGVPDHFLNYFDWVKWTRDLFMCDYWSAVDPNTFNVYVFRNC